LSHPVGSPREERKVEVEEESTTYCFNIFPGFLEVEAFKLNKFMQLSMAIQNALTDSNNLWQIFYYKFEFVKLDGLTTSTFLYLLQNWCFFVSTTFSVASDENAAKSFMVMSFRSLKHKL